MIDLILRFADGRIAGDGWDGIGAFTIAGEYSEHTMDCCWTKMYTGRHSVDYFGCKEGKHIWGTWNLRKAKGGFQIWPIGSQPSLDGVSIEKDLELSEAIGEFAEIET